MVKFSSSLSEYGSVAVFLTSALMFTGCGSSEEQTLEPLPSDTTATPAVSLDFSSMEADPFPLTVEEFEKRQSSIPDEENAALVVLAVAEAMDQLHAEEIRRLSRVLPAENKKPDQLMEPGEWKEVERLISLTDPSLISLDQILTLDQALYPVEFKKGDMANTLIPYLASVANLSRLLHLRNSYYVHIGNWEKSLETLKLQLALQKTLEKEWSSLALLTSWAICRGALLDVTNALSVKSLPEETRSEMLSLVQSIDISRDLHSALSGERMILMDYFRTFSEKPNSAAGKIKLLLSSLGSDKEGTKLMVRSDYVETSIEKDFEMAKKFYDLTLNSPVLGVYPEFWKSYEAMQKLLNEVQTQGTLEYSGLKMNPEEFQRQVRQGMRPEMESDKAKIEELPILSRIFITETSTILERHANIQTRIAVAETAFHTLEYIENNEGTIPAKLEDFSAEFQSSWPMDPYTGEPLQYRGSRDSFRIFSYGSEYVKPLRGEGLPELNPSDPEIETEVWVK